MLCKKCGYKNLENSFFCQECGHKVEEIKIEKSEIKKSIYQEIEDIVFVPKKKPSLLRYFLLILFISGISLYVLPLLFLTPQTNIETKNKETDDQTTFPINYLNFSDKPKLKWGGNYNNVAYLTGVIKNTFSKHAYNIVVRLDFYYEKDLKSLFDTRYVTIPGVAANGAYTLEEEVPNFSPKKKFYSTTKIESAELKP